MALLAKRLPIAQVPKLTAMNHRQDMVDHAGQPPAVLTYWIVLDERAACLLPLVREVSRVLLSRAVIEPMRHLETLTPWVRCGPCGNLGHQK